MITTQELRQNLILDWNEISDQYDNPDLLLGNGFSLQFSGNFSYTSLFNLFLANCDQVYRDLFSQFGTSNFELIQRYLVYAKKVNQLLGLPIDPVDLALQHLKTGLIATIEAVHPRVEDINFNQLNNVAKQLVNFGNIFTTNYDLYLYHIIMQSNDIKRNTAGYIAYQDYYWGNEAPNGFRQFMDYQDYDYKHLYYLHGSLCIFKDGLESLKLTRTNQTTELGDLIAAQIQNNNFPIFITEGSGVEKQLAISENRYLTFCLDKLEESENAILVFGNVLGEFDTHILRAIKENPKEIVYSIYIGDRTIADVNSERFNFLSKFNDYNTDLIKFVDSTTVFQL